MPKQLNTKTANFIKYDFNEEGAEIDDLNDMPHIDDGDLFIGDELFDDGDSEILDVSDADLDLTDDAIQSKHKIEGKHSLKYDSIFRGKKDDPVEEDYTGIETNPTNIEVDRSSSQYGESVDSEQYIRNKLIKEKVYSVLKKNTDLNFLNNRRKPSRADFNGYYSLLYRELRADSFTNIELFNELSFYFSDNLFNMFKLLDNKWRNLIINELQHHIGKTSNSKEIMNRNIYEGTEIEFSWNDEFNNTKIITGVVIETFYEESKFRVDSYENIYIISIGDIIKILNNTKFKYNLNKLNNIDFL
jgi:hypothetical protein